MAGLPFLDGVPASHKHRVRGGRASFRIHEPTVFYYQSNCGEPTSDLGWNWKKPVEWDRDGPKSLLERIDQWDAKLWRLLLMDNCARLY